MTAASPAGRSGLTPTSGSSPAWWFIAGGAVASLFAIALLFHPAVASVSVTLFTGICLLTGGIALVVAAVAGRDQRGASIGTAVLGILVAVCGLLLWTDLLDGTATLTAIVIVWLLVDGLVGAGVALWTRPEGWGVSLLGSVISLALGVLLWADWPSSASWVLGVYAGIVLLFHGLSTMLTGFALRQQRG